VVSAYQSGQQRKTPYFAVQRGAQQEKQARTQAMTMQVQAALKQREAETNFKLRTAESQARLNNAKNIEMQAAAQTRVNDINLQKRRLDFARAQSTQRAMIADSGVVESSGTPLDLIAETAGKIQQIRKSSTTRANCSGARFFARPRKKDSAASWRWPAQRLTVTPRLPRRRCRASAHAGKLWPGFGRQRLRA
jgi:hypothetical protein